MSRCLVEGWETRSKGLPGKYLPSNIHIFSNICPQIYLHKYLPSDMYICTNTFHQISEQIFKYTNICPQICLFKYFSPQIFDKKYICSNIFNETHLRKYFPSNCKCVSSLIHKYKYKYFPSIICAQIFVPIIPAQIYSLKYISAKYFPSNISPALFALKFTYTNIPKWI